jgi:hypothetical protein
MSEPNDEATKCDPTKHHYIPLGVVDGKTYPIVCEMCGDYKTFELKSQS